MCNEPQVVPLRLGRAWHWWLVKFCTSPKYQIALLYMYRHVVPSLHKICMILYADAQASQIVAGQHLNDAMNVAIIAISCQASSISLRTLRVTSIWKAS